MSPRKWPNTDIWQFSERHLRAIHRSAWRRAGEDLFGLERGQLRAHVDREMPEIEIRAIEARIRELSAACVAARQQEADLERQAHEALAEECRQRQESRYRVAMDNDPDELELFLRIMDLTAFPSEEEREAHKDAFRKKAA